MINKVVIVVPCFNEETRFNENYFNKLISIQNTFWIFVDDGSTDCTSEILRRFSNKKNTLYLKINHNVGKSNAISRGMHHAFKKISGLSWVGFLDSDGAFEVPDVENIIKMTNLNFEKNNDNNIETNLQNNDLNKKDSDDSFESVLSKLKELLLEDKK